VGTVNAYERALKQFHGWLAEMNYDTDPNALTAAEIKEFMRALVFKYHNLKNSTRAQKLSAIKSFFAYLISEGWLIGNPADDVATPRIPKTLPSKFTTKDLAKLFAEPGDDLWGLRDLAILKVLYASGLRVSEICSLDVDDIDDTGRYTNLLILGKGEKPRLVSMVANPAAALRHWVIPRLGINTEHKALFITRRSSERMSPDSMNDVLQKYANKVGMAKGSAFVHKMRATCFADMYDSMMTRCHACGAAITKHDIYTLAAFAGHSDPKTMQAYVEISELSRKMRIPDRRFSEIESKL
jgi:site-specific recombinase XerD